MTVNGAYFTPALFAFLRELRDNNEKAWFQSNKDRYIADVRDPLLGFIADFGDHLGRISTQFLADPRPVGGSMFRIYRDTRFSKDKSPYKTAASAHFRHAWGKDVHTPGFYLHLEPDLCFAGAGIWHPDADTLARIRDTMVADPASWKTATSGKAFKAQWELGGESLKRNPRGYDPDHPLIEDLKRKDFVCGASFTEEDACAPGFMRQFTDMCRTAVPFMRYLTTAMGAPW
ncbi:MAG: DUF2461 domain-containing protein [Alphaproteobacteria bacterium]